MKFFPITVVFSILFILPSYGQRKTDWSIRKIYIKNVAYEDRDFIKIAAFINEKEVQDLTKDDRDDLIQRFGYVKQAIANSCRDKVQNILADPNSELDRITNEILIGGKEVDLSQIEEANCFLFASATYSKEEDKINMYLKIYDFKGVILSDEIVTFSSGLLTSSRGLKLKMNEAIKNLIRKSNSIDCQYNFIEDHLAFKKVKEEYQSAAIKREKENVALYGELLIDMYSEISSINELCLSSENRERWREIYKEDDELSNYIRQTEIVLLTISGGNNNKSMREQYNQEMDRYILLLDALDQEAKDLKKIKDINGFKKFGKKLIAIVQEGIALSERKLGLVEGSEQTKLKKFRIYLKTDIIFLNRLVVNMIAIRDNYSELGHISDEAYEILDDYIDTSHRKIEKLKKKYQIN